MASKKETNGQPEGLHTAAKEAMGEQRQHLTPTVMIGSIFRDSSGGGDLSRWMQQVETLDYPKDRLRLVCLEGDSLDNTRGRLAAWKPGCEYELLRLDVGGKRLGHVISEERLTNLSRCTNEVMNHFDDEDYYLYITSDLIWPPSLLQTLIDNINTVDDVDIISCPVLMEGTDDFYDVWGFRQGDQQINRMGGWFGPGCFDWDFPWHPCVDVENRFQVDTIGSIFLARGKVIRNGIRFTPTEDVVGFSKAATASGFQIWVTPDTAVYHPPHGVNQIR